MISWFKAFVRSWWPSKEPEAKKTRSLEIEFRNRQSHADCSAWHKRVAAKRFR